MRWGPNWQRLFITVGGLLIAVLALYLWVGWKPARPGVRYMGELFEIRDALEQYYERHQKYPQSHSMPPAIGQFLPEVEVPRTPRGNLYVWMDNTVDGQKYCVWADWSVLYEESNERNYGYLLISPCGESTVFRLPITLDQCCEMSERK